MDGGDSEDVVATLRAHDNDLERAYVHTLRALHVQAVEWQRCRRELETSSPSSSRRGAIGVHFDTLNRLVRCAVGLERHITEATTGPQWAVAAGLEMTDQQLEASLARSLMPPPVGFTADPWPDAEAEPVNAVAYELHVERCRQARSDPYMHPFISPGLRVTLPWTGPYRRIYRHA